MNHRALEVPTDSPYSLNRVDLVGRPVLQGKACEISGTRSIKSGLQAFSLYKWLI